MNDKLDAALNYAENGLAVFPLVPNAKEPLTDHGFKDASTDTAKIKAWWTKYPEANIGIATGNMSGGLVAIDLDVKNNAGGPQSYDAWLEKEWLVMPQTLTAKTWSGGRHIFFRYRTPVPSRTGWLKGVDVRSDGGYVVAAPSIINGEPYEWEISPEDSNIVSEDEDECVWYLLDEIRSNGHVQKTESLKVPDKISVGGRNDMLYKFACSMQAKGASDDAIMAAVKAENMAKCEPPLPDSEIEKLVRSALTKEKGTSQAAAAQQQEQPLNKPKEFDFAIMDPFEAKDLMAMDVPDPVAFVGIDAKVPLLSEGSCVLAAKAKAGKSWFCTNLCWALASGNDFLGFKTKKCKVQYYDLEQGRNIEKKRLTMISESLGSVPEGFFISTKLQRLGHGLIEQLEHDIQLNPDIGVFIIDVFEKVRTDKKSTETDYTYTYRDFDFINKFADRHHVAVILLFHSRKTIDPTDPFSDILGSTAIQGASTQMIVLTKDKYNAKNTKLIAKGRTMDGLIEMEYCLEKGICTVADSSVPAGDEGLEEFYNSDIRKAVLELMNTREDWKGRCSAFIADCAMIGVGINGEPKDVGMFLSRNMGRLMKIDGIQVRIIKNGSGGNSYELHNTVDNTVDTVDDRFISVDETPFDPA